MHIINLINYLQDYIILFLYLFNFFILKLAHFFYINPKKIVDDEYYSDKKELENEIENLEEKKKAIKEWEKISLKILKNF